MAVVAPKRLAFNQAVTVFEDPDISFNDLTERLMVTNTSKGRTVTWVYAQREYVLIPGAKPKAVPLEVIIKYLGDPRSAPGVQNTYHIPGTSQPGTVPDRYKELRRLSVLYGVYEGMMSRMNEIKFKDIPRDRHDPKRNLFPNNDPNDFVVPRIKVQDLDGHEIKFPVFHPDSSPYRYESDAEGDIGDVRTEMERTRRVMAQMAERLESLEALEESGDAEIPGAVEDSVGPPTM